MNPEQIAKAMTERKLNNMFKLGAFSLASVLFRAFRDRGVVWSKKPARVAQSVAVVLGIKCNASECDHHKTFLWLLSMAKAYGGEWKPSKTVARLIRCYDQQLNVPTQIAKPGPGWEDLKAFLKTDAGKARWRTLRYKAMAAHPCCHLCGRGAKDGVALHVDHIKPKSVFPHLAFELSNLQVLCADCNLGKGNLGTQDFR